MGRLHLFEICDQGWCPRMLRRGVTEYLATAIRMTKLYQPTAAVLAELLRGSHEKTLLVLAAGSGGGVVDVLPQLPADTRVILTDILPDLEFHSSDARVQYRREPVDAFNLPKDLPGVWVMYTAFHHFPPAAAKRILESAMDTKRSIAIFEGAPRGWKGVLTAFLIPFVLLFLTPFVRPFRWNRLLLTYLIPIYPVIAFWDGLVSNLRTYDVEEMRALTADLAGYDWDVRYLSGRPQDLPTLVGRPKGA